jgi:hypothetical protein
MFILKKNKDNGIRKDYKTPIKEILSESSLQFVLRPTESKHYFVKVIWTIFLIVFFFLAIFFCTKSLQSYLEFETITSIYEIVEKETEFPTISICNPNIRSFSITLLDLRFNGQILTSDWQNHIEKYKDVWYGDCYRFNSGFNMTKQKVPIKYLKRSGRNDGFNLEFYLDPRRDIGEMLVYIHNHTMTPSTINNKAYYISSSCKNNFIVKKKIDIKLDSPFNDCYKNVSNSLSNKTLINFIQNKNRTYTQNECFDLCVNLVFNETNDCDATLTYDLEVTIETIINSGTTRLQDKKACIQKFMDEFNKLDICNNYCPLECDSYTYDITESVQPILGSGDLSSNFSYPEFLTFKNFTNTFFSVNVYFEDLVYTLITQQAKYEVFDLVSSIGGIIGLFIGFSFISLLEIFEIIAEFIFIYFN